MDSSSPIPPPLRHRLEQLDHDIHSGLAQVRRHLQELEAVERQAEAQPGRQQTFAQVLRTVLGSAAPRSGTRPADGA